MPRKAKPKPAPPQEVFSRLEGLYPDAHTELVYRTPLDLLVATILSAQCTDVRVNIVTRSLFQKYRTPEDYLAVPVDELDRDIASINFHYTKAKNIQGSCR